MGKDSHISRQGGQSSMKWYKSPTEYLSLYDPLHSQSPLSSPIQHNKDKKKVGQLSVLMGLSASFKQATLFSPGVC